MVDADALTLRHGERLIQRDLTFTVRTGEVLVIAGGSGCGKSTLLRHLIGLQRPAAGRVRYDGQDLYSAEGEALATLRRRFGVTFQGGALWSSMSVGQNVMLPMAQFTTLPVAECEQRARFKLALVGLDGAFDQAPSALSGGMRKRAAIARALALDPPLLYLDEPSAGLDPVNARRLDELILRLRDDLGTTVVMVTHDIDSLFTVGDRVLFLDALEHTMTALDTPAALLANGPPTVRDFLSHGRRSSPGAPG